MAEKSVDQAPLRTKLSHSELRANLEQIAIKFNKLFRQFQLVPSEEGSKELRLIQERWAKKMQAHRVKGINWNLLEAESVVVNDELDNLLLSSGQSARQLSIASSSSVVPVVLPQRTMATAAQLQSQTIQDFYDFLKFLGLEAHVGDIGVRPSGSVRPSPSFGQFGAVGPGFFKIPLGNQNLLISDFSLLKVKDYVDLMTNVLVDSGITMDKLHQVFASLKLKRLTWDELERKANIHGYGAFYVCRKILHSFGDKDGKVNEVLVILNRLELNYPMNEIQNKIREMIQK